MTDDPEGQSDPLLSDADLSLNLDRQKRLAKRLRDALQQGEPNALDRLARHHPRAARLTPDVIKLSDAQLVIAREAGTASWPALKAHVTGLEKARSAIESGAAAPDSDLPTLHVRCGHDLERGLRQAGFAGDFLCHDDPLCDGPVPVGPDYMETRVAFLSHTYPGVSADEVRKRMNATEAQLSMMQDYPRIVLWFEHDPYDQFCLVDVLSRLSTLPRRKLEMVTLDRYPGLTRFIGLGQLAPAAIRHLYETRTAVPEAAFALGHKTRQALADRSPLTLMALARKTSPTLPFLKGSILRHLSELPATTNGLGFSEEAALRLIADGAPTWGRVFHSFMTSLDPLPYFGDLMFLGLLQRLARADDPPMRFAEDPMEGDWGRTRVEITETGHALLAGQRDFRDCAPQPRSVGGIPCFGEPDWRWDAAEGEPGPR